MLTLRTRPPRGIAAALAITGLSSCTDAASPPRDAVARPADIPLKEAKLNIEHNATDQDTGFQGFIDSEGWSRLEVVGPAGAILLLAGRGELADLGLTELFFETVEPANADVPIAEMLAKLPAGEYTIQGRAQEDGESLGVTSGTALLTHDIPAGPVLMTPAEDATVPVADLIVQWGAVTQTLDGRPLEIVAYQLIIEKDEPPPPHMIGKLGLSMYLPPTTTTITVPAGFFEPRTDYQWEVLAIETSGNQTLSSSAFRTR